MAILGVSGLSVTSQAPRSSIFVTFPKHSNQRHICVDSTFLNMLFSPRNSCRFWRGFLRTFMAVNDSTINNPGQFVNLGMGARDVWRVFVEYM